MLIFLFTTSGFGGMITFYLRGGIQESRQFLSTLKLFVCAESLGAVESLAGVFL